jgi:DNA topoisomerase I
MSDQPQCSPVNCAGASSGDSRTAHRAGLVYVSDKMPGIARRRAGRTFRYLTPSRRVIRDSNTLRRIRALAVPPAYRDVWICRTPRGHLQATGRDARGRKQYRYHHAWREARDGLKFHRMADFVAALPALRRRLRRDLALKELCREKVLACCVSILSTSAARIGNAEYARDNHSFGITTLRNRHVSFMRSGRTRLNFVGKGGVQHEIVIDRKRIVDVVRRCHALPGQHLFQYLDEDGTRRPIDSGMVNAYVCDAMGGDFTAKDFRTWNATMRAIELLRSLEVPSRPKAVRRTCAAVLHSVAELLRNTPAVCRKSYVNPQVFTAWQNGTLRARLGHLVRLNGSRSERALSRFLREIQRYDAYGSER